MTTPSKIGRAAAALAAVLLAASLTPTTAALSLREPPGPDEDFVIEFTILPDGAVEVHRLPGNAHCEILPAAFSGVAVADAGLDGAVALGPGARVSCTPDVLELPDADGGTWTRTCKLTASVTVFVGVGEGYAGCGNIQTSCLAVGGHCTTTAAGFPPGSCGGWGRATHYVLVRCTGSWSWAYSI